MMRCIECAVEIQTDQRSGLRTEIIGDLGHVNESVAGLEHLPVVRVEEI
jgi:hypothetical protein